MGQVGMGVSTVIPDIDFETYSEAGFQWDGHKYIPLPGAKEKGLPAIGIARYASDPSTEILSLAYDLKTGIGAQIWRPGEPLPVDLFRYVLYGGKLEAWNAGFEWWIWNRVGIEKYGFPPLLVNQLRCAAAKARAYALPGRLVQAGAILNTNIQKDKDGMRLLKLFSMPRDPTAKDARRRIYPNADSPDSAKFWAYNIQDIQAEAEISSKVPDLSETEQRYWEIDQAINHRGVQIDVPLIEASIQIVEEALLKYNAELRAITNGLIETAAQVGELTKWVNSQGVKLSNFQEETLTEVLKDTTLPPQVRRVIEIRQLIGSAAVKKPRKMRNQVTSWGRLHDMFVYHAARTGRSSGEGPQPHNFPNSGPVVWECGECGHHYLRRPVCPWCNRPVARKAVEWNQAAVEDTIEIISHGNLALAEHFFGDALEVISGCLRGMFIAAPGKDLMCSDYKAIEAVVLAALAGEEWRLDIFRTHGKIYEMSASKITGIPFEEFERHYEEHKSHHPLRKTVGKVAELASGYQGWVGAWKQFGADEFFNEEEMKTAILAWRRENPHIVALWAQLQEQAIKAVQNPNREFYVTSGISYIVREDILFCRLPSGRYLTYHQPRLNLAAPPRVGLQLSFMGWNTNPKNGAIGWTRMSTYGGKLTENIVQAVARDIFLHGIKNLETAGYGVVLHTHDEICCEIAKDWGNEREFERLMTNLPVWCKDWPIRSSGTWRGKRYRK